MTKTLIMGAGAHAVVEEYRAKGMTEIWGHDEGCDSVFVYGKRLEEIYFPTDYFSSIVYGKSTLPSKIELEELFRMVRQEGCCVMNFPIMNTLNEFEASARELGFKITSKTNLGLIVFELVKPLQTRPKILFPPGMGDVYWSVVKLQSLLERENLSLPDICVVCDKMGFEGHLRAFPFLEMFPFLNSTGVTFDFDRERYQVIWDEANAHPARSIFKDIHGCDYFVSYIGRLHAGEELDQVDPDLRCNWFPPMFVSLEQEQFKKECIVRYGDYIVLHFNFHGHYTVWAEQFSADQVIEAIRELAHGSKHTLVFAGAIWDREWDKMLTSVRESVRDCVVDLIGQTNVAQLFGLLRGARAVVGYPSGLTMMAAVLRKPTLIIWNDYYHKGHHWNIVPPDVRNKTYFVENTNGLTSDRLVSRIKEIISGSN